MKINVRVETGLLAIALRYIAYACRSEQVFIRAQQVNEDQRLQQ